MFNIRISQKLADLIAETGKAFDVTANGVLNNTVKRIQSGRIEFTAEPDIVKVKSRCGKFVIQIRVPLVYYRYKFSCHISARGFDQLPYGVDNAMFRIAIAANCLYELERYNAKMRKEQERIAALDMQYQNGKDYVVGDNTPMRVAELRALAGWC